MKLKLTALVATTCLVAACASTPPPVESEPVRAPASAPVQQPAPAPAAPVEVGPLAGSVAEFQEVAGDRVYFGYDRYDLTGTAQETLARQAAWLTSYPQVNLVIEGHADERGTREYNLALGARRANAVRDFLVARGVSENRIQTISYGKERPIAAESNERAWSLNRNGHTRIVSGAVGMQQS